MKLKIMLLAINAKLRFRFMLLCQKYDACIHELRVTVLIGDVRVQPLTAPKREVHIFLQGRETHV